MFYIQYVVNGVVACPVASVIILFSTYQVLRRSCESLILFLRSFDLKDFCLEEHFFIDQIRRPGIRIVPQNPYTGRMSDTLGLRL